jgi:hypothetical protein
MKPPLEGVVARGLAAGALTRPLTCTVAAGLCPDVYVRWWCVLRRRAVVDRLRWLGVDGFEVKDSENVFVQEKRRVKARSS